MIMMDGNDNDDNGRWQTIMILMEIAEEVSRGLLLLLNDYDIISYDIIMMTIFIISIIITTNNAIMRYINGWDD